MSNQIVGNVGLYYVCYRLSCLGWNVMPTARNAKGIDLVIYSQDAKRKLTIQVKALSKCDNVPLGSGVEKIFGDFLIVCRNVSMEKPECFIITPDEVSRLAYRTKPSIRSRRSAWLQTKAYDTGEFLEKWERIGKGVTDPLISNKALPPIAE